MKGHLGASLWALRTEAWQYRVVLGEAGVSSQAWLWNQIQSAEGVRGGSVPLPKPHELSVGVSRPPRLGSQTPAQEPQTEEMLSVNMGLGGWPCRVAQPALTCSHTQ